MTLPKVPRTKDIGRLVSLKGTITRTGPVKLLERSKMYVCVKCKSELKSLYDYEEGGISLPECCGKVKSVDVGDVVGSCIDYQEITMQEQVGKLIVGTIPRSICVLLENDLVDLCKAGDDVTVTGVTIRRWRYSQVGDRCVLSLNLLANHIVVHNIHISAVTTDEIQTEHQCFWVKLFLKYNQKARHKENTLKGRNEIIKSICPNLFGMYYVKLALALVLIGGVAKHDRSGIKVRADCHMLLVGDPGKLSFFIPSLQVLGKYIRICISNQSHSYLDLPCVLVADLF